MSSKCRPARQPADQAARRAVVAGAGRALRHAFQAPNLNCRAAEYAPRIGERGDNTLFGQPRRRRGVSGTHLPVIQVDATLRTFPEVPYGRS